MEKLYEMLNNGEVFGEILSHRLGGTFFWEVLSVSQNKQYIRWRNYGSSANKNTQKDLAWILSEIFKMTPEEFMAKYTTYSEYKKGASVDLTLLYRRLSEHCGHDVSIVKYGLGHGCYCLECNDCNEVIMDTDVYDLSGLEGM